MNKSFRGAGALSTIARVDSLRSQTHCHALEWPCFAPRVQRDSHGDATAKRCQKERIRVRSGAVTAGIHRFVSDQRLVFTIAHFVLQVYERSYRYIAHFAVSLSAHRVSDSSSSRSLILHENGFHFRAWRLVSTGSAGVLARIVPRARTFP